MLTARALQRSTVPLTALVPSTTLRSAHIPARPRPSSGTMPRGAVLALSHGGGPLPVLGDPGSDALATSLRTRAPSVLRLDDPDPANRPKAIVLVTAHWSRRSPTISSSATHKLYYDYGGFPPEAYRLKY